VTKRTHYSSLGCLKPLVLISVNCFQVTSQVAGERKCTCANLANEGPLLRVTAEVVTQVAALGEDGATIL
jgi:hypothetical protein